MFPLQDSKNLGGLDVRLGVSQAFAMSWRRVRASGSIILRALDPDVKVPYEAADPILYNPHWESHPATASRLCHRIEQLDRCRAR